LNLNNKVANKTSGYTGRKNIFHIQFSNVVLYKRLERIGLSTKKTKILGPLKIPTKYFFDFLRGHLDGDGTIYFYKDKRWKNSWLIYTCFLSYSLNHLVWIQNRLKEFLSINGYLNKGSQVWRLKYAKRESLKLLSNLYYSDELPFLRRKRRVFIIL
jgi:intein-encoded DNA endonuclease-like protein